MTILKKNRRKIFSWFPHPRSRPILKFNDSDYQTTNIISISSVLMTVADNCVKLNCVRFRDFFKIFKYKQPGYCTGRELLMSEFIKREIRNLWTSTNYVKKYPKMQKLTELQFVPKRTCIRVLIKLCLYFLTQCSPNWDDIYPSSLLRIVTSVTVAPTRCPVTKCIINRT